MDYPIAIVDQVRQHLIAFRKTRDMTQADLGARIGVGQARVAAIENDPTAISVEQFFRILSALDVGLVLRDPAHDPTPDSLDTGAVPKGSW